MKKKSIHLTGYTGQNYPSLLPMLEHLQAILVDVRFNPASRVPRWTKASLSAALGERYVHVKELGNAGYKTGRLQFVDLKAGLRTIESLLAQPDVATVVIMCGCEDAEICHRTPIGDALGKQGYDCYEIEGWEEFLAEELNGGVSETRSLF